MPNLFNLLLAVLFAFHAWPHGPVLNQGGSPECVGYAWEEWGISAHGYPANWPSADDIYIAAKQVDGYPPGTQGTSIEAAARVLQQVDLVERYTITTDTATAALFLRVLGPIIVESPWYEPLTADGHLTVTPLRDENHAYYCYGEKVDADGPDFLCQNSWGSDWNGNGQFWVRASELEQMPLHEYALPFKSGWWNYNRIQPR